MQRLKRAVKRIAAIGTGIAMLGATMTGALAQPDLADYPSPFIVDGKDSGNIAIVVGADARSADTIGALDLAKQLQFDSKVCAPDSVASGSISVSGDSVEISTSSDLLELRESIGDVRSSLSDIEVTGGGLAGGRITTDEGSTEYNQYIKFLDNTLGIDNAPRVNFTENEGIIQGYVGDYLYIQDANDSALSTEAFFEYELEFESGLESTVTSSTLPDLEDEEVNIMGTTYTIVDTVVDTSLKSMTLTLLGGAVYDILGEGETKTYTIDGKDYEVTVMIIEDVSPATVTFEINGEITKQLKDSQTTTLDDGTLVGVSDIVLNEAGEAGSGDIVEMYLGATKLVLKDTDYTDASFSNNVEIDNEDVSNGMVAIIASEPSSTKVEITSLKYRLSADATTGEDIWVEPGHGVREYLEEPQGMLGTEWDIRYEGLDDVQTSIIKFDPSSSNKYNLIFENMQGLVYNAPFSSNEGSNYKYGTDDKALVFEEGTYNASAFNATQQIPTVGYLDYFVLSNVDATSGWDSEAVSHIVRYSNYNAQNKELRFNDLATNEVKKVIYSTTSPANGTLGSGDLRIGATTYKVYVANVTSGNPPLIIDMDGNSTLVGDEVRITVNGGAILDLGDHAESTGGGWVVTQATDNLTGVWTGGTSGDTIATSANVTIKTLQEDFDEDGPETGGVSSDEWFSFLVGPRANAEVGINKTDFTTVAGFSSLQEDAENDDYFYGMTDYGALITLYDASSSDNPETLTIEYPLSQRGARVFVTFGETTTTKTAAGESCTVADLTIANLLDEDVSSPEDYNLIVVGGPCANTIAADLFMTCDAWSYGPSEAIISMVENGDNVALLVAGTEGTDTRRAAKILADYTNEDLSGSEYMA